MTVSGETGHTGLPASELFIAVPRWDPAKGFFGPLPFHKRQPPLEAGFQPSIFRSHHRRFVHPVHAAGAYFAVGDRFEDFDSAAFSQNTGEAEVPAAVFTETNPARSQGKELIDAVVEMKRRNRTWGCKRIAQQIALAFGVDIDKDVVRRILSVHFYPEAGSGGPSWLSFIGQAKDSLWSLDLFRCESAILRTYWVLVVKRSAPSSFILLSGLRPVGRDALVR
jgi:hypothetical protein